MNNTVLIYASLVRFAHTVFAMPFALIGFVYALRTTDFHTARPWGWLLVQVVLCMIFARNAAMGFNRWADRHLDARNPRTAGREIPAGVISPARALWFVGINAALFLAVAATINPLTAALAPLRSPSCCFTAIANGSPAWPIWCSACRSASHPSEPTSP